MPAQYEIVDELKDMEKNGLLDKKKYLTKEIKNNDDEIEENNILKINLLSSLLENITDSIYFKDKEGRFIELSQAKASHLNTDKKNIVGKTDFDFYPFEQAKKMQEDDRYVMEKKEILLKEEKITRPNGKTAWASVVKAPRYDINGDVAGIVGISRDITDEKNAEKKLHESETKYRTIFENSAVAIMMTDENEQITQWNTFTEQLLDMNKNDLLNKPVKSLYPDTEWKKIRKENIREKGMQHHLETKMLKKDGRTVDVDISLSVLKNKTGKITGSIGVIRGITERKKMEHELRIKDIAIESSINAIVITDLNGNITYANPSFLKLWRYKNSKEIIGKPIVKFWKMKGKYVEVMDAILTKDGWVGELKAERHDKSVFDTELSATSVKDSDGQPICMMASFMDITKRKQSEEKILENAEEIKVANKELKITQEQLFELNEQLEHKVNERTAEINKLLKQKDEFIGQLGHDLKTPLTPLNSLLPIVHKKVEDEQLKKYLDLTIKNVKYMKNLIEKTLKIALLNSTSFNLNIEDINVFEIFDTVIQNRANNFEEKSREIENLVSKDIQIQADKLRFEELVDNIISNAIKYSPDEGKITITAKKEKNEIKFSVKDTGQGMTKEQTERIFDEFYKADESRHDFNSTGLGLSICQRIVKKHGGHIWVESPGLNKGSVFYFTFKISKNEKK